MCAKVRLGKEDAGAVERKLISFAFPVVKSPGMLLQLVGGWGVRGLRGIQWMGWNVSGEHQGWLFGDNILKHCCCEEHSQ